ncbi:hypothetical protein [Pseudomonas sp. MF6768]|uniref:hypothetical protein n=1 Tax=Pseudomonas sp. MF6768 TaxID=2797532 RepID=UPI0018E7F4EC|nr:hypothetical protein [Pseudomonas sp. MF6768]MBJ2241949.1 hypothetical protein [Pseudomonas sp. MF6768]
MQKEYLNVVFGGTSYVGYEFDNLPLGAALLAAQQQIDQVANQARTSVLGDPLRAVELDLAATEAKAFAAADFTGDVPRSVQAWVDAAELTPQVAAENILAEWADWVEVLQKIRAARLMGKQGVLKATSHRAAEAAADQAITLIRESVVGIGDA